MISLEKWKILTPLQNMPNNVGNLGKIIVATGFEWLQKIAQSGHTDSIEKTLCKSLHSECFISAQQSYSTLIFLVLALAQINLFNPEH